MKVSVYFAPLPNPLFKYWRQKSAKFEKGFVVRLLWLGVAVRYSKVKRKCHKCRKCKE